MNDVVRNRKNIFVCYSRQDDHFVDRVLVHLKALNGICDISTFIDRKIEVGDKWKEEIIDALKESGTAVILLSADSVASDFISVEELPPLVDAAKSGHAKIYCILVGPCQWKLLDFISEVQFVNSPDEPLTGASHHAREVIYNSLVEEIYKWIGGE